MNLAWKIEFTEAAKKQLKKLDAPTSKRLINWLEERILYTSNPRLWGKALQENPKDKWRYRIGEYRVISDIQEQKLIVRVIEVVHRKEIYR